MNADQPAGEVLRQALAIAVEAGERAGLTVDGKTVAYVVPVADVELLRDLEAVEEGAAQGHQANEVDEGGRYRRRWDVKDPGWQLRAAEAG